MTGVLVSILLIQPKTHAKQVALFFLFQARIVALLPARSVVSNLLFLPFCYALSDQRSHSVVLVACQSNTADSLEL